MFSKFMYRSLRKKYKNYLSAEVLDRAARHWGCTNIKTSSLIPAYIIFGILYAFLVPISIFHNDARPVLLTTLLLILTVGGYAVYFKFIQRYITAMESTKETVDKLLEANTYKKLITLSRRGSMDGIELVFYSQYSINMFFEALAKYHNTSLKNIVDRYSYGLSGIPIDILYNEMKFYYDKRITLINGVIYFTSSDAYYIADMRRYGDYTVELL